MPTRDIVAATSNPSARLGLRQVDAASGLGARGEDAINRLAAVGRTLLGSSEHGLAEAQIDPLLLTPVWGIGRAQADPALRSVRFLENEQGDRGKLLVQVARLDEVADALVGFDLFRPARLNPAHADERHPFLAELKLVQRSQVLDIALGERALF